MRLAVVGSKPVVHEGAFVHKEAVVVGNVILSNNSSVWPGAVLRADKGGIKVGEGSNVQDCVVLQSYGREVVIGSYSSIGKGAILNACHVGDSVVIGSKAVILEDAVIGDGSIIGEGAVVPKYSVIPPNSLVFGDPARVQGPVDSHGVSHIKEQAHKYLNLARKYL